MTNNSALTPQEVADILKIAKNTVYELIKRGELNAYKVGKKIRVDLKDVENYKNRTKKHIVNLNQNTTYEKAPKNRGFIISGQDILLDVLARHLKNHPNGIEALRSHEGSYNGLYALYQDRVQMATAHLWDSDTGEYNIPYVRRMLPGIPAVIIRLAGRIQGFYVRKGNPKGVHSWEDLKRQDLAIINREKGSGVRVLLDEHLRKLGILSKTIRGYEREYSSHLAVASAVARGEADLGIGNEKASLQVKDIDFIPLQPEKYDLVIKKENLNKAPFTAALDILRSREFKLEMEGIGGYDLTETGNIIAET
ncbi:MAG: helix-turn-helix transcriptional regulator [Syntrophomonadaceae bacterium]|nr:helix-turn-helix transcriptional regulator [Syntrophomonadaceae bacterium]